MSNQPPPYNRQYNFEDYQSLNPTTPLPGDKVEAELNAARSSVNQTISRLNEIQNADGSLKVPGALVAQTTDTATSVATTVATTTAANYLAANYDPTVAVQAAASASDAASWAADAANSKQLAEAHMTNAEAAGLVAQNAAIDSAIARSESRSHAIDANQSRNEAHASAQSAAASYADVGQVYGSALSLKNWIDSQAYQFVHKREDTSSVAANMLFNEGDVSNTLIGQIFKNASFDSNSNVTYPAPNNNGYNFLNGPWWIVGNPAPENPEVIIMRDMMNCMVQTWKTFGASVAQGEIKPMQVGVNGAPNSEWAQLNVPGTAFIKPIIYSAAEFNTNQISYAGVQRAALTPKGYVDYEINRVQGIANQAQSTANVARQEVIDAKIAVYDNGRTYNEGDIVYLNGKIYWFNTYIGGAGYGPITHPAAWTELSSSTDLTGYATESFVTSQGYLTSIPAGFVEISDSGDSDTIKQDDLTAIRNSGWISELSTATYTTTITYIDGYTGEPTSSEVTISGPSSYHNQSVTVTNGGNGGEAVFNGSFWTLYLGTTNTTLQGYYGTFTNGMILSVTDGSPYANIDVLEGGYGPLIAPKTKGNEFVYQDELVAEAGKLAPKSGTTFTGKVNFTSVGGLAGLNVGIGGTSASATTPGDLWITTGGANLNFRDGTGAWKVLASLQNGNVFSAVQTVNVTSASTALRVTQLGTGRALVIEDGSTQNPDQDATVIDNSGNVGVGVNSATWNATSKLEVIGNIKSTTLSTGSGPTFSLDSTAAHSGGSDTLDAIVTINGVNYRIGLRPA